MYRKTFNNKKIQIDIVDTGTNNQIAKKFSIKKLIKSDNFLLMNGDAIFDFLI